VDNFFVMRSSEEFIELLKRGDRQATSELYDQYSAALYGAILRVIKTRPEAETVLEKTFIRILEEIHHYKKHVSLFTWMFCIARAVAAEQVALNAPRSERTLARGDKADFTESDLEVLKGMPLLCQQILNRLYFQGHTVIQISKELSLSVEEIQHHLRNGLKHIYNRSHKITL
jgi:DNA-directed RNA polymerase specialized sigma24 family protein